MNSEFGNFGQSNLLQKKWVRILISIIGGSVLSEAVFISTGNPNRPRTDVNHIMPLFFMIGFYFLFTFLLRISRKIK